MVRRNVLNQVRIIILVTLLLLVVIGATKSTKKIRHCLKNCHKCKRHYGDLFVSHLCARTCIKHEGRIRVNCKNLRSITPYLDDRVWIILKTPPRQSPNLLELNSVPRELIYQGRANRRPSTRNSYKGINAAYLIIPISSSDSKLLE